MAEVNLNGAGVQKSVTAGQNNNNLRKSSVNSASGRKVGNGERISSVATGVDSTGIMGKSTVEY